MCGSRTRAITMVMVVVIPASGTMARFSGRNKHYQEVEQHARHRNRGGLPLPVDTCDFGRITCALPISHGYFKSTD
ncbi:hypothetical protein EVAR_50737_1 [Eumeta japonica]|uniref:Secreted protein n=1 Tax=Eumeta variegata TaxID=151549 RepID=A0A4C1Y260_EUMVA|nr:hypothetical protein EVAR_50737_1 [Eumeta japonica]